MDPIDPKLPEILAKLAAARQAYVRPFRVVSGPAGIWALDKEPPQDRVPKVPLHEYLDWILDQLHCGQYDLVAADADGRVQSLRIGSEAAHVGFTMEAVAQHVQKPRALSLLGSVVLSPKHGRAEQYPS